LNKAHDIRVKKEAFSIGDSWVVYVDDEQIAEIKGEVFPVLGDTYSMYSNAGNLVGAETEDFLTLTHGSKTYDYMGEQRGYIKQKALTFGYDFDIYEKFENVGNVRQKFSLGLQADIKDSDGKVEYNVDKEFFSFGSDITISKVSTEKETSVDAIDAVWATVMMNEIDEAQNSDSGNNNNK